MPVADNISPMPEADSGDVFLRNRGAILDALLADPAFGHGATPSSETDIPDPVSEADSAVGFDESLLAAPAGERVEVGAGVTPPSEGYAAAPDSGPAVSRPRRSTAGPSASERINALLSGQLPDPGPSSSLAAENSERVAGRLAGATATETEPDRAPEPDPVRAERPSPEERAREVVEQLRRPKVALAVAAAIALLIVIVLVLTSGGEKSDSSPLAITAAPTQPAPQTTEAAGSGTIEVESAESSCPSGGTDGMDAFSGEPDKAWACPRAYKIDGQVLRIDLGKEYEIDSIAIVPGWDHVGTDGTDQWTEYRTVSRVSYQFDDDDKTTYTQETLDQRSLVVTRIEPPVTASEITLTVLKSSGPASVNTVAISSIVVTGQ